MTSENRAAMRNIQEELGNRLIDTGITEQTLCGMAAGLALCGKKPIIHALATFLTMRAFEFIRTDIGIGNLPVKIVGAVPGILSEANGPTHQAIEDISIMRGIPNMKVFAPTDREELGLGMEKILHDKAPWYIRYTNLEPVTDHDAFEIGKAERIFEGDEITFITYGALFQQCYRAAIMLRNLGYSVGLVNIRSLKPIDEKTIFEIFSQSKLVVTVEDHFLTGGLFSIIAELMALHQVSGKIYPIAFANRWFKPAMLPDVLQYERLRAEDIAARVEKYFSEQVLRTSPVPLIHN
jgi:transketolase